MTRAASAEHEVTGTRPLLEVVERLYSVDRFAAFADDLGLIGQILQGTHETGHEHGLSSGVPFVRNLGGLAVNSHWAPLKSYMDYALTWGFRKHRWALRDERLRANAFLEENQGLVYVFDERQDDLAEVTDVIVGLGGGTTASSVYSPDLLYPLSGQAVIADPRGYMHRCRTERLPDMAMRRLFEADAEI